MFQEKCSLDIIILKGENRYETDEEYRKRIQQIRKKNYDVLITTYELIPRLISKDRHNINFTNEALNTEADRRKNSSNS